MTVLPLREPYEFPPFNAVTREAIDQALGILLKDNQTAMEAAIQRHQRELSVNLLTECADYSERLDHVWGLVGHLHSVADQPWLRECYEHWLPALTEYHTQWAQNESLYALFDRLRHEEPFASQNNVQQRAVLDHALKAFRLAGVHLPAKDKEQFKQLQQQLAQWEHEFQNNVLDATDAWHLNVTDEQRLMGIPQDALQRFKQQAQSEGQTGYRVTLKMPDYLAVMQHAADRALRQELYIAYSTRASDQGPHAGRWDNTPKMHQILKGREQLAQLVGYSSYAEYSLADKMASSPEEVENFLKQLLSHAHARGLKDLKMLQDHAQKKYGWTDVQVWDVAFLTERLQEEQYHFSQEALRPYFNIHRVLKGLQDIVHRLYDIQLCEETAVPGAWHPDVTLWSIKNASGEVLGYLYLDLYARVGKHSGAWMSGYQSRHRYQGGWLQTPIASVVCNFAPGSGEEPALLTHDELLTLFHEMGHALHHLLTQMEHSSIAGTHGVCWDAVELPSQFFEFWAWQKESLQLFAQHYQTGETLPEDLLNQLLATQQFQSGLRMLRQLEFAWFDLNIHALPADQVNVMQVLSEIRRAVSVLPTPEFNRFPHSFTHIFSGGYAAGYYSYQWADVLASDAFSKFEEDGIFNATVGQSFKQHILEAGGVSDPMTLFVAFRGRKPKIDALLRHVFGERSP